jgi:hypothetical protein
MSSSSQNQPSKRRKKEDIPVSLKPHIEADHLRFVVSTSKWGPEHLAGVNVKIHLVRKSLSDGLPQRTTDMIEAVVADVGGRMRAVRQLLPNLKPQVEIYRFGLRSHSNDSPYCSHIQRGIHLAANPTGQVLLRIPSEYWRYAQRSGLGFRNPRAPEI